MFLDELGDGRDFVLANIGYFSTFLLPVLLPYFLLLSRRLDLVTATIFLRLLINALLFLFPHLFSRLFH